MPIIGPKSSAESAIRGKTRASTQVNPAPAAAQPRPSPAPPDARTRGNPRVSAILPVSQDADGLDRAFACLAGQSLSEIEILLVPNGADPPVLARIDRLKAADPRVRVIYRECAGLAAALNHALRDARAPLVARMDADDECAPDRLARQVRFMDANPATAALGCAWEVVDPDGRVVCTVRPPRSPARLRWKLLTGNQLAHGSVMLRRQAVLDAGGYDESCSRGQDYELWLRLSRDGAVAALPDVLYRYHARTTRGLATSEAQARVAAEVMLDAWNALADTNDTAPLREMLACALLDDDHAASALDRVERLLDEQGPSRQALLAHLWLCAKAPGATRAAVEACRLSRLREVGSDLRARGIESVWLWGAGRHTDWLLAHVDQLGLAVEGVVDDAPPDQCRCPLPVRRPDSLRPGQTVLISTDAFEEQIWRASEPLRARGVDVVRLYAS